MMLHEAVMLEIYRQALSASELASPRCQSRESNISGGIGDGHCSSNDSQYSGNGSATPAPTPAPASPPVGLPLAATLAPAAAAALLPPQSAAMAAYFNAAAVAAQQNHLLLTNPLAAAASLVQQATQSQSPNTTTIAASHSPNDDAADSSILDFSTKRSRRESNGNASDDEDAIDEEKSDENESGILNGESLHEDGNSPLDLSVGSGRKRQLSTDDLDTDESRLQPTSRKILRTNDYKHMAPGTWVPPINPYLAAVAAASLSPKTSIPLDWNGKQKIAPNEATKALEKMTEMTRLGSATETDMPSMRYTSTNVSASANSSGGRHSAWQSHWLNKGADAVKDVFKCVWCKQSFPTLATLTTHMKETQHCGVNVPPSSNSGGGSMTAGNNTSNQTAPSMHHTRHHSSTQGVPNNAVTSSSTTGSSSTKSDLNLLIKETMPLPRKLVRGQDVWLGKGAEQTRQILKCMWCGQSFRSLAEMTSHMQETQHYTNIISQEQIISWKSTDDKSPSGSVSSNGPTTSPALATPPANANNVGASVNGMQNSSAPVSAVLTCKVCDQAFASLKELSNHMVKNCHYKEHIMRSAGDASPNLTPRGRGRQTREKRKKSLPVRKLLELERAQQDFKNNSLDPALKPLRDFAASTKISCEKCGDKIETALFVDHIRQCLGGSIMSPRHTMKTPYTPAAMNAERLTSPQIRSSQYSNGRKTADDNISPLSTRPDIISPISKEGEKSSSTPSVLSAIEQLIEKSFDTRARHGNSYGGASQSNTPLGSSILKRLGIDESVDYTKPLMDPQTMHFLRSYSSYSGRDRSASESSSVSERGSSRLESLTPEHNSEISRHTTPRLTPEKSSISIEQTVEHFRNDAPADVVIKTEPCDVVDQQHRELQESTEIPQKISVKKEFNMTDEEVPTLSKNATEQEIQRPLHTPNGSRAHSPNISERSTTPKSAASSMGSDKKMNSLNALSSMFDSLNNIGTGGSVGLANVSTTNTGETNNNNTAGKKPNSNPLAALQKLCEKTDPPAANARSNISSSNTANNLHAAALSNNNNNNNSSSNKQHAMPNGGNTGNMVAFSWACNDAVMTSDSIIKCSFCDTPFCSKGAYRHHLSKVHFVKDAEADATMANKSPARTTTAASSPHSSVSPKGNARSPAAQRQSTVSPAAAITTAAAAGMVGVTLTPTINPYDESPQSKFLKYTELAKQLSSKNV